MSEFLNKYNDILSVFNKGKTMVLSSCEDNKVSSRMMSIVCIDGIVDYPYTTRCYIGKVH